MVLLPDIDLRTELHQWFRFHYRCQRADNLVRPHDDMEREIMRKSELLSLNSTAMRSPGRTLNGCVREKLSEGEDEAEAETALQAAEVTEAVELRVFEATVSALLAAATEGP